MTEVLSGARDPALIDLVRDAEATLGWRIDHERFVRNYADTCFGDALNLEHDYLD